MGFLVAAWIGASCGGTPVEGTGGVSVSGSSATAAASGTASVGSTAAACPEPCDDGIACTEDVCEAGTCVHTPSDALCPAGTVCDPAVGGCKGGSCDTCTPTNPCDMVSCVDDQCVHNESCGPDLVCCDATCVPPGCNDGDPCTDDSCGGPGVGCVHEPATGTACDDGNACTENDTCQVGVCQAGEPVDCDDGNECTTDSCDPATGCVHVPVVDGTPCNDGNACTQGESCVQGMCMGGTPITCNDQKPCTKDMCDPQVGCVFPPDDGKPCDDDSACTVNDVCSNGMCVGDPVVCDDGNPCTQDMCDDQMGCIAMPDPNKDGMPCDDGSACTENDKCANGVCGGDPVVCDDGNPCTQDTCDDQMGCVAMPDPDKNGDSCDDGNACTENDKCANGVCGGDPVVCNDNDPCTTDFCDPQSGCDTVVNPNC